MKPGRSKLIFSAFSLAVALALAVFTVYAWFIKFENVAATGIKTSITSNDVIDFTIDYYYTTHDSENATSYQIGSKIDLKDNKRAMRPYSPLLEDLAESTAVLLVLTITFSRAGDYVLTAKATHGNEAYSETDFNKYTGNNYLSNVVYWRKLEDEAVNWTDKTLSVDEGLTEFNFISKYFDGINDKGKKSGSVQLLPTYAVASGATGKTQTHQIYFLMDYMPQQISSLYFIMLELFPKAEGLSLNTQITFEQDIIFEVGKKN